MMRRQGRTQDWDIGATLWVGGGQGQIQLCSVVPVQAARLCACCKNMNCHFLRLGEGQAPFT